jgi:hypothetical protein
MTPKEAANELVEAFLKTNVSLERAKSNALICAEQIAKRLPNINDVPPVHRVSEEGYMQFWRHNVTKEIDLI